MTTAGDHESGIVAASSGFPRSTRGIVSAPREAQATTAAGAAISFVDNGGLILTNVHVQLIFWGPSWGGTPTPTIDDVTNAVVNILSGPYMSALNQYRGIGQGTLKGATLVITPVGSSPADPPATFSGGDVETLITNLVNGGLLPGPTTDGQLWYCVVMPPGKSFTDTNVVGEHTYFSVAGGNAHYGWVTNGGTLDSVTWIFSHELVESATDPEGSAILGTPGTCTQGGWCEIGDVCEGNTGNVNGVLVQAYWSQRDNGCVIPDAKYTKDHKDTKDTKDHKDKDKDTKDHKDRKDNKDGAKEKDKDAKEKDLDSPQLTSILSQLDQRMNELGQRIDQISQQLATGQAFIRPEERPPVGEQALNQSQVEEE